MNEKIPQYLFRGDADPHGIRSLRATLDYDQLQTNLLNGGNGREIFEAPLVKLLAKHIAIGWPCTHFLSFSSLKKTAYHYGLNDKEFKLQDPEDKCEYGDGDDYTFALLTFHTEKIRWTETSPGVFEGLYDTDLITFKKDNPTYRILLFDVCKILSLNPDDKLKEAIENANRDQEWLLLPATLKEFNFGQKGFSGIMDASCISHEKIKWTGF